jgi:hypothetical protein
VPITDAVWLEISKLIIDHLRTISTWEFLHPSPLMNKNIEGEDVGNLL